MTNSARRYWLMKSEEDVYPLRKLKKDGRTCWDGIRNYQARNFMRDDMQRGDGVFFYHSNAKPMGIAGIARVVSDKAYPDHTQFEKKSDYYDPKSKPEDPTWLMVDIEFVAEFDRILPLAEMKELPQLASMAVLQRGQRLSVMPVTEAEWRAVLAHLGMKDPL